MAVNVVPDLVIDLTKSLLYNNDLSGKPNINDSSTTSTTATWSAKKISTSLNSKATIDNTNYTDFNALPIANGIYSLSATSVANAPVTTSSAYWWDTIVFGTSSRLVQITTNAYINHPGHGIIYFRTKHDTNWSRWYALPSATVSGSTLNIKL